MSQSDQERFEDLYRENARRVLAYALTRTSPESAHDAVASTFLVAWRRFDQVPDDPLPWLIGTARRVLAGQRRSETRRRALGERLGRLATPAASTMEDLPDTLVLRGSIRDALVRLRPQDRDLVVLSAWHGFDTGQLAVALGCSKSVASLRLHRARRRFASFLEQEQAAAPVRPPTMQPAREIP